MHQAGAILGGDKPAHPQPRDVHVHVAVIDIVGLAVDVRRVYNVRVERRILVEAIRLRAADELAVRVVEHAVHAAAVHRQVVPLELAAVELDVVNVLLHDLNQPPRGVVRDGVVVHDQHKHQRQRRQQEHHQRYPRRNSQFRRHSSVLP